MRFRYVLSFLLFRIRLIVVFSWSQIFDLANDEIDNVHCVSNVHLTISICVSVSLNISGSSGFSVN